MKRKGLLTLMFGALAISALASCGQTEPTSTPSTTTGTVTTTSTPTSAPTSTPTSAPTSTPSTTTGTATTPEVKVLSYTEYMAAEMNTEVTIEAYVQAKQSWWSDNGVGKATLYLADEDGAYFVYQLQISEKDYNKLTEGTKIRVTGVKGKWSGEIEIMGSQAGAEATYEIITGDTYVSTVKELTLSEDLTGYQNQRVAFKNLTVVAQDDGVSAFYYKGGKVGDDLYFNVTDGTTTYTFVVESYLTDENSDVYKAVTSLKVGDVINLEGFLYWYKGPQLHTTKLEVVTPASTN